MCVSPNSKYIFFCRERTYRSDGMGVLTHQKGKNEVLNYSLGLLERRLAKKITYYSGGSREASPISATVARFLGGFGGFLMRLYRATQL